MEVIDISINRSFDLLWKDTLKKIEASDDHLKENYLGLDPRKFECFTILVDQDQIICFSALQISPDRWGNKIARCSTRMWIAPEQRFYGMTKFSSGPKFLNSYYCLPLQIKKSQDMGIECLFMSREENPKAFSKWSGLVNANCGTNFICLDHRYNVCGRLNPVPESCKQYISLDFSNESSIDVWNKNMQKFLIREDSNLDYREY